MRRTITSSPVLDVDMHFNEPTGTWDEITPEFREGGLRLRTEEGRRWLYAGERRLMPLRATFPGEVDEAREAVRDDPLGYEKILRARRSSARSSYWRPAHPAESNAVERLKVLDAMGVQAALLFPSLGLFWPSLVEDSTLVDANFTAWNNWAARVTSVDASRLLAAAQYSLTDVQRAVVEIRRCKALGLKGVFIRAVPYCGRPWGDPLNEPVWRTLAELDLPLLLHSAPIGSLAVDPAWEKGIPPDHVGQTLQTFLNRGRPPEAVLSNLIFEGVLERHPALRVGVIEFGSTWVPSFLQQLDFTYGFLGPRNRYLRERLTMAPSEYFRRQVKVSSFWSEPLVWLFAAAGDDLFMFSSDFPHPEGNESALSRAREVLAGQPTETLHKFFYENAKWLLGLGPHQSAGGSAVMG